MNNPDPYAELTETEWDEAAHWFVLGEGDLNEVDRARYRQWLSEGDAREVAIRSLSQTMRSSVLEEALETSNRSVSVNTSKWQALLTDLRWPQITYGGGAIAAAILLAVVLAGNPFVSQAPLQFQTASGERTEFVLPDDSYLVLNAQTQVEFEELDQSRILNITKGQIFVNVRHQDSSKFEFKTAHGVIEVVGTSLDIDVTSSRLQVTVVEGRVLVTADNTAMVYELNTGEQLQIRDGVVAIAQDIVFDDVLAWRDGWLQTDGISLEELVIQVNRYTEQPIILGDPSMLSRTIAGRFRLDEPEVVISNVTEALGLTVESQPYGVVLTNGIDVTP